MFHTRSKRAAADTKYSCRRFWVWHGSIDASSRGKLSLHGEVLHEQVADGDACKALDGAEGPSRLPCELTGPEDAILTAIGRHGTIARLNC